MKNIEIKTSQNVVLQYELADLRDRIIAFIIDLVAISVGCTVFSVAGGAIMAGSETGGVIVIIFVILIASFYTLAFETFNNGQTLGKMAMRIQVIKTSGGQATFADYAARWAFRLMDIYLSFGTIACILIVSSVKAQRIGDIVANTSVVKLVPQMDFNLAQLLAIHDNKQYKIVYPQARQLHEEDVLIIKKTLDRYRYFGNDAHHDAVIELAEKLREIMGLDSTPADKRFFLQTVLQDYVVMTR